jgi:CRP-like cAMP-binding protein
MSLDARVEFLQTVSLFEGMNQRELRRFAEELPAKRYAAGETVFFQGDRGDALYIVRSGLFRVYIHGEDGKEISVVLYGPRSFFGELALIDDSPRSATVEAMMDSVLLVMDRKQFRFYRDENPQLQDNLAKILSQKLRRTNVEIGVLLTRDVRQRVIDTLLFLARSQGERDDLGIRIRGRLTQQDLASLIRSSRESVNRALRALVRKGLLLLDNGEMVLLDMEALRRIAGGGE